MKKNQKISFTALFGFIFFFVLAAKIYYELKWYDLLLGILKLEFGNKPIVLVSQKSLMFVSKKASAEDSLKMVMKKNEWDYVDHYGKGYIFTNNDEELLLKRRDFSFGYVIFEIYPHENYRKTFRD